jgi:hypothetical protein
MTQRFVSGEGKSAIVNGLPSGPITYLEPGPSSPLILDTLRRTTKNFAYQLQSIWMGICGARKHRLHMICSWQNIRAANRQARLPHRKSQRFFFGRVEPGFSQHAGFWLRNSKSILGIFVQPVPQAADRDAEHISGACSISLAQSQSHKYVISFYIGQFRANVLHRQTLPERA